MKCKNCGSSIVPIQEVGPGFQGKGWCAYCADSMPDPKDARIAALESALAKAEEALNGISCDCRGMIEDCDFCKPIDAALAAIKEARHD